MALTEKTEIDRCEILLDGTIQARTALIIERDGVEYLESHGNFLLFRISESLHRTLLNEFDKRNILVKSDMEASCMKGVIRFGVTCDEVMQDIFEFFDS